MPTNLDFINIRRLLPNNNAISNARRPGAKSLTCGMIPINGHKTMTIP